MLAGSLELQMSANLARLADDLAKAKQMVGDSAGKISDSLASLKRMAEGLGLGLSLAGLGALVKNAADSADAAAKMSDRFGIATDTLIGMQHAADLAGVSNEGLTNALRGIAKSSVEAAQGNEQARAAFQRLGLQASEFIKLPMNEQLSLVIDRLGKMENAAVRNATAQTVMGRNAGDVMGLVAEGSAAFQKASDDTEAWGLALSRVDAAKIEMANDAMKRAEAATKGVFTQISVALSPAVIALANHFADAKAQARGYRDEIAEGSDAVIEAIGYAMNFVQGLRFAWTAAKLAVAEFADFTVSSLAKVLSLIPNSWGDQMKLMAESTRATADSVKEELDRIAAEGLPKDQIVARIREVSAALAVEAQKIADNRAKFMKAGGDPGITQFDAYTAALAQHLGQVIEGNKNELQLTEEMYARKQAMLDEAQQRGIITDDFWQGQSALLYASYEANLTRIHDQELMRRYGISQVYHQLELGAASSFFGALGGMMVSHNHLAFEIGKAAAISQTVIDTYRAAQGAYAALAGIPLVGPALGAAAAAAAIVVGLARVQQIKSTAFGGGSIGGGGGAPTFDANPSTGVPTAPASPLQGQQAPSQQTVINVNITGVVTQTVLDQMLDGIRDAIDNNDAVIIGANSRQAAQLAGA